MPYLNNPLATYAPENGPREQRRDRHCLRTYPAAPVSIACIALPGSRTHTHLQDIPCCQDAKNIRMTGASICLPL
jgi:hypothetical protein